MANAPVQILGELSVDLRRAARQMEQFAKTQTVRMEVANDNRVTQKIQRVNKELDKGTNAAKNFGQALALKTEQFAVYTIAAAAIGKVTFELVKATREAIRFEQEMVRLGQVFQSNQLINRDLQQSIRELAVEYGQSANQLARTGLILAQTGLSAKETERALEALTKTTLAATFSNIERTTEGAVAIMNQFKIEATDLVDVMDSINAVSKEFAVESNDIIEAVKRAGGAFKAAGGNFNEFIALFTSVRSTTRENAETIATGFRTIFARIQRPKVIDYFRELGIELENLDGTFVGPIEGVQRISVGLNKLGIVAGQTKFAEVVEQLGGLRQVARVIPLLGETAKAQQALAVAQNASGSVAEDAARAQQTLGFQLDQTKQRFEDLVFEITQTQAFQEIASGALRVANAMITMAESLKEVLPLILALQTVRVGFQFTQGLKGLFSNVNSAAANLASPPIQLGGRGSIGYAAGGHIINAHGTEYVLTKGKNPELISGPQSGFTTMVDKNSFIVPIDTPATRGNPALTKFRIQQAKDAGYNTRGLPQMAAGGFMTGGDTGGELGALERNRAQLTAEYQELHSELKTLASDVTVSDDYFKKMVGSLQDLAQTIDSVTRDISEVRQKAGLPSEAEERTENEKRERRRESARKGVETRKENQRKKEEARARRSEAGKKGQRTKDNKQALESILNASPIVINAQAPAGVSQPADVITGVPYHQSYVSHEVADSRVRGPLQVGRRRQPHGFDRDLSTRGQKTLYDIEDRQMRDLRNFLREQSSEGIQADREEDAARASERRRARTAAIRRLPPEGISLKAIAQLSGGDDGITRDMFGESSSSLTLKRPKSEEEKTLRKTRRFNQKRDEFVGRSNAKLANFAQGLGIASVAATALADKFGSYSEIIETVSGALISLTGTIYVLNQASQALAASRALEQSTTLQNFTRGGLSGVARGKAGGGGPIKAGRLGGVASFALVAAAAITVSAVFSKTAKSAAMLAESAIESGNVITAGAQARIKAEHEGSSTITKSAAALSAGLGFLVAGPVGALIGGLAGVVAGILSMTSVIRNFISYFASFEIFGSTVEDWTMGMIPNIKANADNAKAIAEHKAKTQQITEATSRLDRRYKLFSDSLKNETDKTKRVDLISDLTDTITSASTNIQGTDDLVGQQRSLERLITNIENEAGPAGAGEAELGRARERLDAIKGEIDARKAATAGIQENIGNVITVARQNGVLGDTIRKLNDGSNLRLDAENQLVRESIKDGSALGNVLKGLTADPAYGNAKDAIRALTNTVLSSAQVFQDAQKRTRKAFSTLQDDILTFTVGGIEEQADLINNQRQAQFVSQAVQAGAVGAIGRGQAGGIAQIERLLGTSLKIGGLTSEQILYGAPGKEETGLLGQRLAQQLPDATPEEVRAAVKKIVDAKNIDQKMLQELKDINASTTGIEQNTQLGAAAAEGAAAPNVNRDAAISAIRSDLIGRQLGQQGEGELRRVIQEQHRAGTLTPQSAMSAAERVATETTHIPSRGHILTTTGVNEDKFNKFKAELTELFNGFETVANAIDRSKNGFPDQIQVIVNQRPTQLPITEITKEVVGQSAPEPTAPAREVD